MRVSEFFELGRSQPTLDFVDVDIRNDTRLFVDPRALRFVPSSWAGECVELVRDYFDAVLEAIREGRDADARRLMLRLREPNETHLGLSRGRSRGRTLGPQSVLKLWEALRDSEAVTSGLIEDLEDAILMVPRVGRDIVSDITTNIIREPLIRYTQDMANLYGIPLEDDINSGWMWDPHTRDWYNELVQLPKTPSGRLLLVPKNIVRRAMEYDVDEYFNSYILEALREQELSAKSSLVHILKNGDQRVYKKDLKEKYGTGKAVIVRETLRNPDVLRRYRDDKARFQRRPPLDHVQLAGEEGTPTPDWDALLGAVVDVLPGREGATEYEQAVEALLTALFYPNLANPILQHQIHNGRKRIDITYTNMALVGFFRWISTHYHAAQVFVECKNYRGDPGNPELDQLCGRFSPRRGRVGLLVCRTISDKAVFTARCRDAADDDRGFVIPLDDADLTELVEERKAKPDDLRVTSLQQKFRALIN